jgi:NAD dependent epimerase/dehydratase family enzyme
VLGEIADSQVLSSTRALPRRLESDGFPFTHPELEEALGSILLRPVLVTNENVRF